MRTNALSVLALVATFFSAAQSATAVAGGDGSAEGVIQLTDDNFKSSVASGVWMVEHYSPRCPHCRSFAPTWEALAAEKKHLESLTGFHMAQVNCLAQGDLCTANDIKFYPQIKVWQDSKVVAAYEGDRSFNDLSAFVDNLSNNYARSLVLSPASAEEATYSGATNPDGEVLQLNPESFKKIKNSGDVAFIEFFAPWCGHCKKLAPTWAALAKELKGKTTVASVDCEEYRSLCKEEGIPGYPTLHLYHDGTRKPFNGARKLEAMVKFGASLAVENPRLLPILKEDFEELVAQDDVLFLFLQTFTSTKADLAAVDAALKPLMGATRSYISRDPSLYTSFSTVPGPSSLLLVFKDHHPKPVATLPFPGDQTPDVSAWVAKHRFELITELTAGNHEELMKSPTGALIVLAALKSGTEGDKDRDALKEVARAWGRGGRKFKQPVWFLWIDGIKWKKFLKQSYGINSKKLPAVVIVDTPNNEYYDMTLEKTNLIFEGQSIFSTLEGVYQHFLRPKKIETTLEWGSRTATVSLISIGQWSIAHPVLAFTTVIGSIVLFVYMLQRCMSRDQIYREVHGEKAGARLD